MGRDVKSCSAQRNVHNYENSLVILLRSVYTTLRLRQNFNIVVNGVVRDFGGKDQSKTQTLTHSVNYFNVRVCFIDKASLKIYK